MIWSYHLRDNYGNGLFLLIQAESEEEADNEAKAQIQKIQGIYPGYHSFDWSDRQVSQVEGPVILAEITNHETDVLNRSDLGGFD